MRDGAQVSGSLAQAARSGRLRVSRRNAKLRAARAVAAVAAAFVSIPAPTAAQSTAGRAGAQSRDVLEIPASVAPRFTFAAVSEVSGCPEQPLRRPIATLALAAVSSNLKCWRFSIVAAAETSAGNGLQGAHQPLILIVPD